MSTMDTSGPVDVEKKYKTMSGSDEEAFASAEEGEEGKSYKSSGKASKGGAQCKGPGATSTETSAEGASCKQKGKQQQQRKKKSKGQHQPGKDQKENVEEKKPAASEGCKKEPQSPSSEAVSSSATASPELAAACLKSEPVAVSAPIKDSDHTVAEIEKADQSNDTDSKAKSESQKFSEISQEKSVTDDKSAADVRKQLQSSTETQASGNPGDLVIPQEAGDESSVSAAEQGRAQRQEKGGGEGGGWSWGWGSSILTAATSSLETFTSQVGEGLTTIIDTVESSLGVPDPEELVRADAAVEPGEGTEGAVTAPVTDQPREHVSTEKQPPSIDKKKQKEEVASASQEKTEEEAGEATAGQAKAQGGGGWLTGWGNITNMGKSFVTKGQTLMNSGFEKAEHLAAGGLDILETIGKKTYTTLTDHDPGLRRAREFLHLNDEKPSLSFVLKEAREKSEYHAKREQECEEARKWNFGALFEDNQGLAHLEALEMLSNQSERKVQSLLSAMAESDVEAVRSQLVEIKDTFQQATQEEDKDAGGDAEHDFNKLVTENLSELHLGTAPDKLNKVQETVRQWIADFYSQEDHSGISSAKEVQQRAVQSLADVTSKAVEQFHKAGELVLMQKDAEKTYLHRAQSLAKLARVLVTEVDILATKFSQCLNKIAEEKDSAEEVNPMVTNVYLEATNASGYIQDAFQLLLPVIQHAALQSALTSSL